MSRQTDGTPHVEPIPEETILEACGDRELPELGVVEQVWETDPIPADEVADRAAAEVATLDFSAVPDGGEIAVGAGSRGIANVPELIRGVVEGLTDRGYEPFVFPAMGSHGGATAEGQREVLEGLGVTEAHVGCEIRATMEVEEVGRTPDRDVPVYSDANAAAADGILPVNRIKAHTDFDGDVESGLSKMLVIGMGKQRGAKMAHEWAVDWSFRNMIPEIASQILDSLPVVGGVAVVEDQHDDTAIIEGIPPAGFLGREAELLEESYEMLPTIPFDEVDVLVVDRAGKDISGSGMDPNVVGRRGYGVEPEPERGPDVSRIFLRGLTPASHGNGTGTGIADFLHADFMGDLTWQDSVINTLTASTPKGARIPPTVTSDRAGVVAAHSTIGVVGPEAVRTLRITDTMHLEQLYASPALVEAARDRDDLRVLEEPEPVAFDEDGQFVAPSPTETH
ncbi:MAG: DUF362 domain-containing protein [Halobacteriaceae archaeon]